MATVAPSWSVSKAALKSNEFHQTLGKTPGPHLRDYPCSNAAPGRSLCPGCPSGLREPEKPRQSSHRGGQAPLTPGPGVEATAASPQGASRAQKTQIQRRLRPRAEPTGSNALPLLPIGARSDLAASSGPMGESHRCCWAGPGRPAPPTTGCARALPHPALHVAHAHSA